MAVQAWGSVGLGLEGPDPKAYSLLLALLLFKNHPKHQRQDSLHCPYKEEYMGGFRELVVFCVFAETVHGSFSWSLFAWDFKGLEAYNAFMAYKVQNM